MEVPEAQQIALESWNELLPPDDLVKRIKKDLKAIRAQFPVVAGLRHTHKWKPGSLLLNDVKPETLEAINKSPYGPSHSKAIFKDRNFLVTFNKPYNPEKLAELLKKDLGVKDASPDVTFGGSSSVLMSIDPSGENTYVFMKGWGDCMSGCINKHYWKFTTGAEENSVKFVSETGDDLESS